jgi:LysM repeat protein
VDQSQQEFQRATRIAAAASMGSMLVISAFAAGVSNHAAASGVTPSSSPAASAANTVPPTVGVASEAVVAQQSVVPTTHAAPVCTKAYLVQPGDFWLRLAKEASVPVSALYAANGATANTPLQAGQKICLPAGASVVQASTPPATAAPVTTVKKQVVKVVVTAPPVTAAKTTRSSH